MNCPKCGKELLNVNGKYVCVDCGIEVPEGTNASPTTIPAPDQQMPTPPQDIPQPNIQPQDNIPEPNVQPQPQAEPLPQPEPQQLGSQPQPQSPVEPSTPDSEKTSLGQETHELMTDLNPQPTALPAGEVPDAPTTNEMPVSPVAVKSVEDALKEQEDILKSEEPAPVAEPSMPSVPVVTSVMANQEATPEPTSPPVGVDVPVRVVQPQPSSPESSVAQASSAQLDPAAVQPSAPPPILQPEPPKPPLDPFDAADSGNSSNVGSMSPNLMNPSTIGQNRSESSFFQDPMYDPSIMPEPGVPEGENLQKNKKKIIVIVILGIVVALLILAGGLIAFNISK